MEANEVPAATQVDPDVRRAGFTALYEAHVAEVYRYVHGRCHETALAEDITQDAFLTAVRTIGDPAEVTIGWLLRVARNRLLDVIRRDARYERKLRLVAGGAPSRHEIEPPPDHMRVREAFATLDVVHRTVLTLRYVDGLSVAALAEELGRTDKAVEGLVTRARRSLRTALEGDHG